MICTECPAAVRQRTTPQRIRILQRGQRDDQKMRRRSWDYEKLFDWSQLGGLRLLHIFVQKISYWRFRGVELLLRISFYFFHLHLLLLWWLKINYERIHKWLLLLSVCNLIFIVNANIAYRINANIVLGGCSFCCCCSFIEYNSRVYYQRKASPPPPSPCLLLPLQPPASLWGIVQKTHRVAGRALLVADLQTILRYRFFSFLHHHGGRVIWLHPVNYSGESLARAGEIFNKFYAIDRELGTRGQRVSISRQRSRDQLSRPRWSPPSGGLIS